MTLDVNELRKTFHYNPETGVLVRLHANACNSRHIGRECRTLSGNGYLSARVGGSIVAVHRIAFALMSGAWPTGIVDHINGNKTDNRWCNLRECSKAQNNQNQHKMNAANSSGVRGVRWHKGVSRWRASISVGGVKIHLGSFTSKEEAIAARYAASAKYHGEFSGVIEEGKPISFKSEAAR